MGAQMQQRRITRFKGATLKIVPSGDSGYMEWVALLPGHPRVTLRDPTSARYSVAGMDWWLSYGRDAVHDYQAYEARQKAGLDTVSYWAIHDPSGVNRFTGDERLVRKNYLQRGMLRLGDYEKRSRDVVIRPRFKIERSLWLARLEARFATMRPYLQEEQNGSISDGKEQLQA